MADFSYQKLGIQDIAVIQQLGRATYEPYYHEIWLPGGIDWYMDKCFGAKTLAQELNDPNIEYLVPRTAQGEAVGLLKLVLNVPVPDANIDAALYLEKIYLLPAFFGKGAGQVLISHVLDRAGALGRQAVWLMVLKNGPVRAYESAGFRIAGEVSWEFELLKPVERGGWVMVREVG